MTPGTATRVAAVIGRLIDLLQDMADDDVAVLDGDQPVDAVDDAIMVAPSDPDSPGAVATYGADPSLGRAPVEQVEVAIVVRSFSGDGDMAARRARCAELVQMVQSICRTHPVEAGIWDRIEFGPNAMWHPVYTDGGANCFVGMSVVAVGLV